MLALRTSAFLCLIKLVLLKMSSVIRGDGSNFRYLQLHRSKNSRKTVILMPWLKSNCLICQISSITVSAPSALSQWEWYWSFSRCLIQHKSKHVICQIIWGKKVSPDLENVFYFLKLGNVKFIFIFAIVVIMNLSSSRTEATFPTMYHLSRCTCEISKYVWYFLNRLHLLRVNCS